MRLKQLKLFKRYIDVYICMYPYIFCIYASLQKSKFTLSMSKYILLYNHYNNSVHSQPKCLIVYQEDIGLKQSVDHDQQVCNDMLNGTALLHVCVCVCAYGCEIGYHHRRHICLPNTHTLPPDTHAHTPRENDLFSSESG